MPERAIVCHLVAALARCLFRHPDAASSTLSITHPCAALRCTPAPYLPLRHVLLFPYPYLLNHTQNLGADVVEVLDTELDPVRIVAAAPDANILKKGGLGECARRLGWMRGSSHHRRQPSFLLRASPVVSIRAQLTRPSPHLPPPTPARPSPPQAGES